ncbi:hypothetical protein [Pseudomonas sp. HY13-MNA-CIBAN-0226]|uniref:hypothetical protein n=1 Tax=Pseudomonas sp. HY13-MNA-CIBAN-0226 TaxID=3140473 RepID=UPI00331E4207
MSVIVDVVTVVGAIGALMIGWVQLDPKKKLELRAWFFKIWIFLSVLVLLSSAVREIVLFGVSEAPLTRKDVLWLLVNAWNGMMYLGLTVAFLAYWTSPNRKGKDAKTPKLSESQE